MKAKSIFRFVLFFLTLLACGIPANAQVEYQPEMEKFLGDWISNSRAGSVEDRMMIRVKRRGDFVTLSMKTYPAQRWLDLYGGSDGPHHCSIENLSFDGSSFKWYYRRSDDEGGYFHYYQTLSYDKGTLIFEEKWYHNDKVLTTFPPAIFMPFDSDW